MTSREEFDDDVRKRYEVHKNQVSHRPLNPEYEYIGMICESAFKDYIGIPMDRRILPWGDGGKDFVTCAGIIDVKGSPTPYNLLVEEGKLIADIFVLAGCDAMVQNAWVIGWAYREELARVKPRDFGTGVMNHYIHNTRLRRMEILKRMVIEGR